MLMKSYIKIKNGKLVFNFFIVMLSLLLLWGATAAQEVIEGRSVVDLSGARGAAIKNTGTSSIDNLDVVLKNNYVNSAEFDANGELTNNGNQAQGGALYNTGTITNGILGELYGNYAVGRNAAGGALYNSSSNFSISKIIGNVANNYSKSYFTSIGGAIYLDVGVINEIANEYITNNYATSKAYYSLGGAIYNHGTIDKITADYVTGNYAESLGGAAGGFIYNSGVLNTIKAKEISNNHVYSEFAYLTYSEGGAIYNYGQIDSISVDLLQNNYAKSRMENALGGAIKNAEDGTIKSINIDKVSGNYAEAYQSADGGVIDNEGKIENITVREFSDNHVKVNKDSDATGYGASNYGSANGGAINNSGQIEKLSVDVLKNNYADAITYDEEGNPLKGGYAQGGAINNTGNINSDRIGVVSGNYAEGYSGAYGGAIYNNGQFDSISADLLQNNHAKSVNDSAGGGAIQNSWDGTIKNINIDKVSGNYAEAFEYADGGAIDNSGNIENITVREFSDNHVKINKDAEIIGYGGMTISGGAYGGAIINSGQIENLSIDVLKNNYADAITYDEEGKPLNGGYAIGGAIANMGNINGGRIGDMSGNYAEGYEGACGGALYNEGYEYTDSQGNTFVEKLTLDEIRGNVTDNHVKAIKGEAFGGAIFNYGGTIKRIENSNFENNYAQVEDGVAKGGAIFTSSDLNIVAKNADSVFKNNYTLSSGQKDDNAIYVANPDAALNLKQEDKGNMYMYDNIRGEAGYKVNISGDGTGTYYMFNDIHNANVTFDNTTINAVNNDVHTYNFKSLTLKSDANFVADVDLKNEQMDRFTADSYGEHQGNLNVVGMNMLSDTKKDSVKIYFAQEGLMNNVKSKVFGLPTSKYQTNAYTPIYKYNVHYIIDKDVYNADKDAGYFEFVKGDKIIYPDGTSGSTGNASDAFNPAVLADSAVVQAGAQTAMNNVFLYAFEHADIFSQLPSANRFAKINSNKYAIASTDFNSNLKYNRDLDNQGVWVKPFSTFENIKLKNGPKVNTINYGTLVGFDSDFHKLKRGWANVATAYVGYSGSQMDYKGVDASTNLGLIGLTETFYKGNFWTALTATAGAGVAEAHTMYGKDDIAMLMAGIGSKTGYNFEFKEGKFIVQPRLFMSYSFVNSFDYTNSAGVRIDSDPMHTVQINPSLRIIGNTKGGWQPYASVGMVWNLLNETNATADGVKLPQMHTRPYVEYGVGLQRTWDDRYSAYVQAMMRNGGRNGVALTLGFRCAIDKDNTQKVEKKHNNLKAKK